MTQRAWIATASLTTTVSVMAAAALLPMSVAVTRGYDRVEVSGAISIEHLPLGAEISLTLGIGSNSSATTRNGEGFSLDGNASTSGLLYAFAEGRPEAIQLVPKFPGVTFPQHPINNESTAIAMMFLTPVMSSYPPVTNGVFVEAAYKSQQLGPLVQAMGEQRAAGGDPITQPNEKVTTAVAGLIADVDSLVLSVLRDAGFNSDPGQIQQSTSLRSDTQATLNLRLPTVQPAAILSSRPTSPTEPTPADAPNNLNPDNQSLDTSIEAWVACESAERVKGPCGLDEVYVNSREGQLNAGDTAAARCAAARAGAITDLDGREGDDACFMLDSVSADTETAQLAATNFSPRWLLVYEESNTGWFPDAAVAPKRWSLPSAYELASILSRGQVVAYKDAAEALFGFFGVNVDIGERENLVRYYQEVFASWATNGYTPFELPIDDPAKGIAFESYGYDTPFYTKPASRGAKPIDIGRLALAWTMTSISEFILPTLLLALDLANGKSAIEGAMGPSDESSTEEGSSFIFALAKLSFVTIDTAIRVSAECGSGQSRDELAACLLRDNASIKEYLKALSGVFLELAICVLAKGDCSDAADIPSSTSPGATKAAKWREGVQSGGRAAFSTGVASAVQVLLSGGDPETLYESLGEVAIDAVTTTIESAIAQTPVGKALGAYAAVRDLAAIGLTAAEIAADSSRLDAIDTYFISPRELVEAPDVEELTSLRSVPRGEPLDVIIIIDRSGSMSGERIEVAMDAAEVLIDLIRADRDDTQGTSRVGVEVFSGESITVLPLTPVDQISPSWRDGVPTPTGSTNIGAALQSAISQMKSTTTTSSRLKRILLLTDGEDTDFGTENIINMLTGKNTVGEADSTYEVVKERLPIDTVAFDFQVANDSRFLQDISLVSGGRFFDAPDYLALAGSFIKSRTLLGGGVVWEGVGTFEAGRASQKLTISEDAFGRVPTDLTVTVYSPDGDPTLSAINPRGEVVDVKILSDSNGVSRILLVNPELGVWTFVMQIELPRVQQEPSPSLVLFTPALLSSANAVREGHESLEGASSGSLEPQQYLLLVTESGSTLVQKNESPPSSPMLFADIRDAIYVLLPFCFAVLSMLAIFFVRGSKMRQESYPRVS